jgi:hypothetical protein
MFVGDEEEDIFSLIMILEQISDGLTHLLVHSKHEIHLIIIGTNDIKGAMCLDHL